MMSQLRVLILEDVPSDAELIVAELERELGPVEWERADTRQAFLRALERAWDIVLADFTLVDFDALDALALAAERGVDLPFVIVTGFFEEAGLECIRRGASDYVLKDNLTRLCPAVRHALEDRRLRKEKTEAEAAVRRSEAYFRSLIENGTEVITILDPDGTVRYESPTLERVLGYTPEALVGRNAFDFVHPDDREHAQAALQRRLEIPGMGPALEIRFHHRDGSWRWLEVRSNNLLANPHIAGLVINSHDITDRKRAEERLVYLSLHDALTGAYNRGYFEEEMARAEVGRVFPVSLIVVDVDGLKAVNDLQGHAQGDVLLQRAAELLRGTFRKEDAVARIGGDEFAVLLAGADAEAAARALERMAHRLEEHNQADRGLPLHLSFGAATGEKGSRLADVMAQADANMYHDKRQTPPPRPASARKKATGRARKGDA
jgi:diguanylate cyclase (GGDEF)-like protein/PAS domain S-box-containing protein